MFMEFEEFKKYIDTVKDTEKFKKIAEFTHMTTMKSNLDIYENIKYYLGMYHARHDCKEFFQPDYDHLINFLEHYLNDKPTEKVLNKRGFIDLPQTLHLVKPRMFCGSSGNFLDNQTMLTDGSVYISKLPLNYRGNSGIRNSDCIYSAVIASYIAKNLQIEAAENTLANAYNGHRIFSKNFLKPNEEMVTYAEETDEVKISELLNTLEEYLKSRRCSEREIEEAKFQFIKQEFMAKMIGLKDQSAQNSPLVVSVDEDGNRHVRMAPMFDFDYSFHIAEKEAPYMLTRKCDNGKIDIASFIEQYKDYPGFEEFVRSSLQKLDMMKVFKNIYEETGIKDFENCEKDEDIMKFADFVNRNIQLARETITKVYESEGR